MMRYVILDCCIISDDARGNIYVKYVTYILNLKASDHRFVFIHNVALFNTYLNIVTWYVHFSINFYDVK